MAAAASSQFDPYLSVMRGGQKLETAMVFRAQPIGDHVPPQMVIAATQVFPNELCRATDSLPVIQQQFETDAKTIVDALHASLPGGTLDQVLRLLLERKASMLVVSF